MNDHRRGRIIGAAIALLLPLIIQEAVLIFACPMEGMDAFYLITLIGALATIIGTRITTPGLRSGLFFGGLLCIGRNYYLNWSALDQNCRFWALGSAFLVLVFIALYKSDKFKFLKSKKTRR